MLSTMKYNYKGFTLIEMLVVIAVIAILATVVLTGVTGFQASARDTRRVGDLRNVQNYLELYFSQCGHYPGGANCTIATPGNWAALSTTITGMGIATVFPNDPVKNRNYSYGVEGTENLQYVIGAKLEKKNSALGSDLTGQIFGVDCTDASLIYCVGS